MGAGRGSGQIFPSQLCSEEDGHLPRGYSPPLPETRGLPHLSTVRTPWFPRRKTHKAQGSPEAAVPRSFTLVPAWTLPPALCRAAVSVHLPMLGSR